MGLKSEVVMVRMTKTLRSMVERRANELGLSRPEFIRMILVAASEPSGEKNRTVSFSEAQNEHVEG